MLSKLWKQQSLKADRKRQGQRSDKKMPLNLSIFRTPARQFLGPADFGRWILGTILGAFLMTSIACSYRSTNPEAPAENNQGIDKSFFFEDVADAKTGQTVHQPKTFLCGWAAEQGIGSYGEQFLTQNVPLADHCNMIFEITESKLLGKQINPSYPDDASKWETILIIPIKNHYYYENEKDSRGRDTQKMIENSGRSHWSARPYMTLDLAGTEIQKWSYNLFLGDSGKSLGVSEIEWDKSNGFLGFTITAAGNLAKYTGASDSNFQGQFRFNFMAFHHNPNFKRTPFADANYKYMNILHVMGKKLNGTQQVLSAAHWDFSKRHEIYLQGFPESYLPIGKRVVEDWNKALRDVGALKDGQEGFVVNTTSLKHTFDLRYPTMVWIDNERLSEYSPLGIAEAHADVKNGEILWGGITLYGGMLEKYVKAYSANNSGGGVEGKSAIGALAKLFSSKFFPKSIGLPDGLKNMLAPSKNGLAQDFLTKRGADFTSEFIKAQNKTNKKQIAGKDADDLQKDWTDKLGKLHNTYFEVMSKLNRPSSLSPADVKEQLFPNFSQKMDEGDAKVASNMSPDQVKSTIKKSVHAVSGGNIACLDRTFNAMGEQWATAVSKSGKSFEDVMGNVVTELIAHEYGHFLGLGHQFKSNIVPEIGTVPEKYIKDLKAFTGENAGYTNYSSVMGYRAPETEIAQKNAVVAGPQDKLVLRYLYNQEYSTYKVGDGDFTFKSIPDSGIVPEDTAGKTAAYFPQCNDTDASLGFDPYCNRFARGSNATEIIKHYIENLDGNLVQTLHAITDSRVTPAWAAENRMWARSFDNLGRVRFFYDYMRYKYRNQINQFRGDENALMEFSTACQATDEAAIQSATLRDSFKKYPEFKELCQANGFALEKIKEFVGTSASDYTKYDIDNRFSPGGISGGEIDRDESKFVGSWTELTALPLKYAALYALTAPTPWVNMGGWMLPVFTYDNPGMRFSYRSLYPQAYTEIMKTNVRENLHFASLGREDRTTMGQSVIAMMMFNYLSELSNDAQLFPNHYINQIRNQTVFDFQLVAIILDGKSGKKASDPNRVGQFVGSIYDFNTGKSTNIDQPYLMADGTVMARAEGALLLPLTPLQLLDDSSGYVLAIRMNFYHESDDKLEKIGMKSDLLNLYQDVYRSCIVANGNGLAAFFNMSEPKFTGFYMPTGVAQDDEKHDQFLKSIKSGFDDYYREFNGKMKPDTCREAVNGIALIVSTAAIVNGTWIGPVGDLIQK